MKLPAVGTRQSRSLALTALALAAVMLFSLIAVPTYLMHRRYDRALGEFSARLERFQAMAAQGPEYAKALEQIKAKNGRRFYLQATALNLAGAELQEMVRSAVEGQGGRLGSIQIGQVREDGNRRLVPVSVQLVASTPVLQRILHVIETQTPFLFVESMTLRTSVFRGYKPTAGAEPDVNVQLEVSALFAGASN